MLNQVCVQTEPAFYIIIRRGGESRFDFMTVQRNMCGLFVCRGCYNGLVQGVGHEEIIGLNDRCIVENERSVVNDSYKSDACISI